MRSNPSRCPSPPKPEHHSFTPSPAPRPELLGNPDPGFAKSARRVGLDPTTLYHWFPASFPEHVVVKALLSRPTLTLPDVARSLLVTPRTVRAWCPLSVRVRFVRFLLLHSRLSLAKVAKRLGDGPALDAWLPPEERFRIARELLGNPDPHFAVSARRVGLSKSSLYNWFPPTFPGHVVVRALLSRPTLTLPDVARRLWVTPQTVRGWIPARIQVRLVRFLLIRAGLTLTHAADRLGIPANTLSGWFSPEERSRLARVLLVRVCQKTPLSELSCHDPPHFPRQLQPNFVQEDASDRSGWGDWWWTGPDLRDAAIGRRSRLLGSGFKG